jgi:exodeoxyribonuclease V beta subunit
VLCRKKKELVRAREALTALGIPCVDRGDQDVFESREAWELACVLRAMLRSGDPASLRAALATAAHGFDASALAGLEDDSSELSAVSERYAEYARIWAQSGFAHALETWRRKEAVLERLLVLEDGERRLTNWLHLTELLQGVALDRSPSRSSLVRWLERAIADEAVRHELGADATLLRLERDDQAVSLVTLHRSKGLQYEIVYLPCLWEGSSTRFPNPEKARNDVGQNPPVSFHDAATHRRSLDLGGSGYADHAAQAIDEERSEQLRLLYVGLTRAKRQCSVFWGAIGKHYAAAPLAWLLDAPEAESEGLDRDGSAKKVAEWNDEQWKQVLQGLADAAGDGAVSIEIAHWEPRSRISPLQSEPSPLRYDPPRRRPPSPRMTTSFSGLVRNALGVAWSGPVAIGRDLDAEVEVESRAERGEGTDLAGGMDTFPRGAEAGTLLHEVLEDVDFASPDEEALGLRARAALERNGLDPSLDESVLHVVRSVARTPLRTEPSVFRLADVARGQLLSELEFTLAAPGEATGRALDPATLAAVLEAAPTESPLTRYAPRAVRLGWRELRGYLRGFIDAVFCDGERYFLIDYKSNHLGATQVDYRPERLIAPMIEHDYVLQYLIYSVALDRHLACILPDYEYDHHFGGVYYLFLRGLAVEHEPGCGVFFDRPDGQTIAAISELLGGAREAGR